MATGDWSAFALHQIHPVIFLLVDEQNIVSRAPPEIISTYKMLV